MSTSALSPEVLAVLDALHDAALVVDRHGLIVFANDLAEPLLGHRPADLVGLQVENLLPPPMRHIHGVMRRKATDDGTRRPMHSGVPIVALCADGSTIPVDISLSPLRGVGDGYTLACIRDRREQARLEQEARAAEDRYRMVVTTASEVFYRVRTDADTLRGQVEFVSPQCERVTGLSPSEFIEHPSLWIDCVHPEDRPVVFRTTQEILQRGVEASRYYRLRHATTGEYRWIADRVVPIRDDGGRVIGHQGVARDITEQRIAELAHQQLEHELRQAQKMEAVGRLAGTVAHDFNNLITLILASTDAAHQYVGDGSLLREHLVEISDAGERATELTRKLLTLSPDPNLIADPPVAPDPLDVNTRLLAAAPLIRRMLPDDVELRWELADGLWEAQLDAGQFDQIVFNLVANARDAMPAGGALTIATGQVAITEVPLTTGGLMPGEYVRIVVSDTGVGMDAATAARALDPFFTTKPSGKGTGLGLASVYGIVRQHRGDIQIDSAPGAGTRVALLVPRAEPDRE